MNVNKDWTGNRNSIYTTLGASNHSDKERQSHDYYATEPKATELLLAEFDGDIITNPPYKYALQFVEKALERVKPGRKVAMFLKLQFLEGKSRKAFFLKHPPKTVYVSSSRLICAMNGDFMSQVNAKLVDISTGIKDIQEYLDAKEQSELETAFQELNEIIAHLKYSIKDADRTRSVVNQLDEIKRISSNSINLHKRSVEKIKGEATFSDNAKVIENNLKDIRNHLIRYHFAAYIYNLADMLKIYMNNVIDIQELKLYRDELAHMVNEYQMIFEETMQWIETYLDETKTLNDASWAQVVTSFGVGIFTGILGSQIKNYKAGTQSALMVNRAFEKNRKKKKNSIVESQKNYKEHVKYVSMLEASVEAIDSYIIATQSKTEIVLCEGEYYIRYIGEDEE